MSDNAGVKQGAEVYGVISFFFLQIVLAPGGVLAYFLYMPASIALIPRPLCTAHGRNFCVPCASPPRRNTQPPLLGPTPQALPPPGPHPALKELTPDEIKETSAANAAAAYRHTFPPLKVRRIAEVPRSPATCPGFCCQKLPRCGLKRCRSGANPSGAIAAGAAQRSVPQQSHAWAYEDQKGFLL